MVLKRRIYALLAALTAITASGALAMVWATYRMEGLLNTLVQENTAAFESAADLETALVNQKGFVTYFFLDGNPVWLDQFDHYQDIFRDRLEQARRLAHTEAQQAAIQNIAARYTTYVELKRRVIDHYKADERQQGTELHTRVRQIFFDIITLCNQYKQLHAAEIQHVRRTTSRIAARLRVTAALAVCLQVLLTVALVLIFIRRMFHPVHRIVRTIVEGHPHLKNADWFAMLSRGVADLRIDVDEARSELIKSRETLLQAEKLAMVGKLAAGMAHSIRNPFTSIKMRLFSLNRSLDLNADQTDDFEVITHEIDHIDTIVQNFLEFSRPAKLVMRPVSPSTVVDNALQLLKHRLLSYEVDVAVVRTAPLPNVMADPEQLKELLANLLINACEAMGRRGAVTIGETVDRDGHRPWAKLTVTDSGPGIPADQRDAVFQPFFTTKEEGTGLGLSIARRIIADHGGTLDLDPVYEEGARFIIRLPLESLDHDDRSDH